MKLSRFAIEFSNDNSAKIKMIFDENLITQVYTMSEQETMQVIQELEKALGQITMFK